MFWICAGRFIQHSVFGQSQTAWGGVFWKSWPDYVVSVESDLTPEAALDWASLQRVTVRPAPGGERRATDMSPNSRRSPRLGKHLDLRRNWTNTNLWRGKSSGKSPRPLCELERHKRSRMLRPSEQVRWSLRRFLRCVHCCDFTGAKSTAFTTLIRAKCYEQWHYYDDLT